MIPLWTTQPYFTAVLSLLTETPRVLNASVQNLIHPTLDGPHPPHQRLQLMVCKLSGDPCIPSTAGVGVGDEDRPELDESGSELKH